MVIDVKDALRVFRSLSDETRLRMLKLLTHRDMCVFEIMDALQVSQTRASRNLGLLEDAGILRSWRDGSWVHYGIDQSWGSGPGRDLLNFLEEVAKEGNILQQDWERMLATLQADREITDTSQA